MRKRLSEAPSSVKIKRAKALANLSQKKYQKFLQTLVDSKYQSKALFLDKFQDSYQQALLDNQVLVWVKTSKSLLGQLKNVKFEKFSKDSILFKIVT